MIREKVIEAIQQKGWSRAEAIRRSRSNEASIKRWLRPKRPSDPHLRTIEPLMATLGLICIPGGSAGKLQAIIVGELRKNRGITAGRHPHVISDIRTAKRGLSIARAEQLIKLLRIKIQ